MRAAVIEGPWVVYRPALKGKPSAFHAVCEQSAWEALEAEVPCLHTLVKGGITSEAEADQLARDVTPPDPRKRRVRRRTW